MRDKLISYVDFLFAGAPVTQENLDLKDEILQNTLERYDDLIAQGKAAGAAYNLAISGIGDISEILGGARSAVNTAPAAATYTNTAAAAPIYQPDMSGKPMLNPKTHTVSKLMLAIAVLLYICCVIPVIVLGDTLGVCLMFLIIGVATALIIFRPKESDYIRQSADDEPVQDPQVKLQKAISGIVFAVFLAVYFVMSFATGAWYITWVLFPLSGAVNGLIRAIMDCASR